MFVHTDLRDTFILDAKHGDLDKSSYVNTYYNFTINSGDEGGTVGIGRIGNVCGC